jgi:hypothetical protein
MKKSTIQGKVLMSLTERNLDWLINFLPNQLEQPNLAEQIPTGAHLFPGSAQDPSLTQANLRLAAKILLGMTLGYVEEAPLLMVYTDRTGAQQVIDLARDLLKRQAQHFVETFQVEAGQRLTSEIHQLLAV